MRRRQSVKSISLVKEKLAEIQESAATILSRKAVRAIIFNESNTELLMVYSQKYGDYGFPGGGIETDESTHTALMREVREETGYNVSQIFQKQFSTEEFHKAILPGSDYFHMISDYFHCSVEDRPQKTRLSVKESEQRIIPVWVSPDKAYSKNIRLLASTPGIKIPWVERETSVLRHLREEHI